MQVREYGPHLGNWFELSCFLVLGIWPRCLVGGDDFPNIRGNDLVITYRLISEEYPGIKPVDFARSGSSNANQWCDVDNADLLRSYSAQTRADLLRSSHSVIISSLQ